MKVYVVVEDYPHEGYGLPKAVFTSKEKAEALAVKLNGRYSSGEVFEYTVDEIPDA